ncbi:MAG: hypothetical protein NVS9B15_09370 [Acidobacteriaceae bacterium]
MPMEPTQVKQCCANVYGSEAARFLLGDSFHPGGAELTQELASRLGLTAQSVVLDVASGKGTSAILLADSVGCRVTGIDLSTENIQTAKSEAAKRGLSSRVEFLLADAEELPFAAATYDAIVCECAFCTFPDKRKAAAEFERVLKPGGQIGISDLTRTLNPLPGLDGLLAWIACIGDAQPLDHYATWLQAAGLRMKLAEARDYALADMVHTIRGKLLLADVMSGLGKLNLPELDLREANQFARAAADAIQRGQLGYGILIAEKPAPSAPL